MSQFNIQVGDIMGKLDLSCSLTVGLALLVGGVGIANTMLMSAMERIVEFGVMRANGWTRRNILSLVTVESALLGLLSGILGSILAVDGVLVLNAFSDPVRAAARADARADRRQQLDGARDRGRRRALPGLARVAHDADGRDPQRGLVSYQSVRLPVRVAVETRMIRVSDLRKTFQSGEEQVHALRGVSFEVPTGAFTFIVGPSGSGKSTLLYLAGRPGHARLRARSRSTTACSPR